MVSPNQPPKDPVCHEDVGKLVGKFQRLRTQDALHWDSQYKDMRFVGQGGQGIVYHCERTGVDGFRLPVALKAFSPSVYASVPDYIADMKRMAAVAMRVSQLQCHQLLDVHNFIVDEGIRVMVMEWVNGHDLRHLLDAKTLDWVSARMSENQRRNLHDVVLTKGPQHSRLKPGIAIQILRESLTGLASLHRAHVAHGDIKPSNLMLNLSGSVKLVDLGSAIDLQKQDTRVSWTPSYAAPEILDGAPKSPQADLASLGYVLIEMLSGRRLFPEAATIDSLRIEKRQLSGRLTEILPPDIVRNRELMDLCQDLTHPEPDKRLESAEEANIVRAANLHRQLVKTNLDSEYENDLRLLMERLPNEQMLTPETDSQGDSKGATRMTTEDLGDAPTIVG